MVSIFQLWSSAANINFHRVTSGQVDLEIRFTPRSHGDNSDFDGPGTVLAHAFYPHATSTLGGDVHMDEDETWSFNISDGEKIEHKLSYELILCQLQKIKMDIKIKENKESLI